VRRNGLRDRHIVLKGVNEYEPGIGALYSRAGVRRYGLRDRHTVLNDVNEYEPVHPIYILPIWVKLPRPAEDPNALPLYIYEFHETWFSKLNSYLSVYM
jgi:hypothetical protein